MKMDGKIPENQADEDDEGFIALANEFLEKCSIRNKVSKLTDCKDEFFVSVYKGLIGDDLKGLIGNPLSTNEHIHNCQCVIDTLAQDILNVDLSHISAEGIVRGDVISIRNLLEIFAGLLEYFLECMDEQSDSEGELDDSNVLTSQHEVISGLLRKEFGSGYQDMYKTEPRSKAPTASTSFNARDTRDNRSKLSSKGATTSGHDADTSEVNDSTNELIKLGETSSSVHSLLDKRNETYNLHTRSKEPVRRDMWSHSTSITDSDDLTQYTLTSEEGQRHTSHTSHKPLDNLSSSLLSSASSYNQQISPLDSGTDEAKLASLGVRPKVGVMATGTADQEGSDSGGSGRSTPMLHHHYHHHFHHPVGSDVKENDGTDIAGVDGTRGVPGTSGIRPHQLQPDRFIIPGPSIDVPRVTLPDHTIPKSGLPSNSIPGTTVPLPDRSVTRPVIPSHGIQTSIPGTTEPLPDRFGRPDIPSHSIPTSIPETTVPLPDRSNTRLGISSHSFTTGIPGTTVPLQDRSITRPGIPSHSFPTSIPGTTVPLPDHSNLGPGIPSHSISTNIPTSTRPFPEHSSRRLDLPSTSLPGPKVPFPSHSSLRTEIPIHSRSRDAPVYSTQKTVPGRDAQLPDYSSLRPGAQSHTGKVTSLSSTAPSLIRTATDPLSSAGTGRFTSSGGLSDSVFTSDAAGLRKPYTSYLEKSRGTGQVRDEQRENLENLVTSDKPSTSKDTDLTKEPSASLKEAKYPEDKHYKESESDGSDSDDSDAARHSDSAIDYNRGDPAHDSDSESTEDSILRRIHERWKRIEAQPKSTSKSARRAVHFNEDDEVIPITSRMDRLRRLLEDEAEEQRQQHTTAMREAYAEQLRDIQKQQENEKSGIKKRKVQRSPMVPKKKARKPPVPTKQRGRLETIYRPQGRTARPKKRPPVKTRKRSASASPDIGRRRKVTDFNEALLPSLFEEFPFLHVSPQTTHAMWQKQARQLSILSKAETEAKKTKVQRSVEEAEKRQERLLKILKKELETNQRMRDEHEREERERAVKTKMNEKRQVAARARRYYDEYQLRMRSKMLKRRTREEQIFKNLFQEGLEIQKQRVRELQKYAKEKRQASEQRQLNEIESLENYYKDQFAMLAEGMTQERNELKIRQEAQEKVIRQMRRELRQKMEKEIRDFQENLNRDEDSAYFRQLEADRLRREFQLAMYKADL